MDTLLTLANCSVSLSHDVPDLLPYLKGYLTPDLTAFDLHLTLNRAKIDAERAFFDGAGGHDGFFASLALCRAFCTDAIFMDVLLFHASAIMVDGGAYLVTAPSGTGKSTHFALWREVLGEKAVMINDDKPLLRRENGIWRAFGSPWRGKHDLGAPISAPIRGICVLERGENRIERMSPISCLPKLYLQTFKPKNQPGMQAQIDLLTNLAAGVPLYRLQCRPDRAAAEMAISHLVGENT